MLTEELKNFFNILKEKGFIYQGSEIYGGLANSFDYGPLGVLLKNNIKKLWWNHFVNNFKFNFGIDSAILMNPNIWKASGHVLNFSDPLVDCKECKNRFRPDKLLEQKLNKKIKLKILKDYDDYILKYNLKCPNCNRNNFTNTKNFELMYRVKNSIINNNENDIFLRPETAQGIFINFKNLLNYSGKKLPFGVCQIGKSFRNEISPKNFIFRTKEFEQMEMEFFYSKHDKSNWFNFWLEQIILFLEKLGINKKNYRFKKHSKEELAHYSKKTIDIEYNFPFGWGEIWGISNRGDYDLKNHSLYSKIDLSFFDYLKNEKYYPYVIEPSVGVERLLLSVLIDAFSKEKKDSKERFFLNINKSIAPFQVSVLPLTKKLEEKAKLIFDNLKNIFVTDFIINGNIGKRYKNQDLIGTPYCVTVDYDSLKDNKVTVRERNTTKQIRIKISYLKEYLLKEFNIL